MQWDSVPGLTCDSDARGIHDVERPLLESCSGQLMPSSGKEKTPVTSLVCVPEPQEHHKSVRQSFLHSPGDRHPDQLPLKATEFQ